MTRLPLHLVACWCLALVAAPALATPPPATPDTGAAPAAGEDLVLVADGVARCQVLVRADAGPWEARAAADLAHFMASMSGARVPVVSAPEAIARLLGPERVPAVQGRPGGRAPSRGPALILVGQLALDHNPDLADRLAELDRPAVLRRDAIVARREGDRVYLAGLNDESHYYAVMELLDRWGCRWFLPTDFGQSIPEQPTLTVGDLDLAWAPPFEVRTYWLSWYGAQDGRAEFMRRNRMNEQSVPAGHALGGYVQDLVPPGKTAYDVCLSSPETIDHVARQVMARFAAGSRAVSLSMDDGIYRSECATDRQLRAGLWDKYFLVPSQTDAFMALYNQVARRVVARFPDRRIGFLAYSNITLPPQRYTEAAAPLVAYLAPIDFCPIHGMDDPRCAERQEYREVMTRWARVMRGRVVIYDYDQSMLVWRDLPNPSVQALRQDVRHYRDAGILGVSTESRGAMATTFLNLYLRGRLLWDPDADVDALLADFYQRFYGPAAAPMRHWWEALLGAWRDTEVHGHEYMVIPAIYTPELVAQLGQAVAAGEAAVRGLPADDPFVQRLRFMRLSQTLLEDYTEMARLAASEVDYAGAVAAGEQGLAARRQLTAMNPTFTTTRLEQGAPWWTGEVAQYRRLAAVTDGRQGRLVKRLPLTWRLRADPFDRGVAAWWARPGEPPGDWREIRVDLVMEPQGVRRPDSSDYDGLVWYRTAVTLDTAAADLRLRFPGLFGEAWLYVDGALVAHRPWQPLWWHNDYGFEWDVDLSAVLHGGRNELALRLYNAHGLGGIWRRPFLWAPVAGAGAGD